MPDDKDYYTPPKVKKFLAVVIALLKSLATALLTELKLGVAWLKSKL